ncbi:uncharacterized protein LOC123514963 isoform X3 [Portunus trituberculatus]|uniref:uncharacterized protein LOC123514963 isoform X3 n=1 Tax=Portunus trituberculatus TaxID=210409 RepID=UPI001E1CD869|nr:uncharacterized protein LOC123514963 isoform X3 [Portunus trituberculatus]XP_045129184.1 uncharacterized protein LOC123514963 isoform X3 [Portunus trituberculatus]
MIMPIRRPLWLWSDPEPSVTSRSRSKRVVVTAPASFSRISLQSCCYKDVTQEQSCNIKIKIKHNWQGPAQDSGRQGDNSDYSTSMANPGVVPQGPSVTGSLAFAPSCQPSTAATGPGCQGVVVMDMETMDTTMVMDPVRDMIMVQQTLESLIACIQELIQNMWSV